MSKLERKIRSASSRGCHIYKVDGMWDVIVDSEYMIGPRGLELTRRQAANLAYSISISKRTYVRFETW